MIYLGKTMVHHKGKSMNIDEVRCHIFTARSMLNVLPSQSVRICQRATKKGEDFFGGDLSGGMDSVTNAGGGGYILIKVRSQLSLPR